MGAFDPVDLSKAFRNLLSIKGEKDAPTVVNTEGQLQVTADISQSGWAKGRFVSSINSGSITALPFGDTRHLVGYMPDSDIFLGARSINNSPSPNLQARILAMRVYVFFSDPAKIVAGQGVGIRFGYRLPSGNYQYFHGHDHIYIQRAGWPTYPFGLYGENGFNPPGVGIVNDRLQPFTQSIIVPEGYTLFAEAMGFPAGEPTIQFGAEIWAVTAPVGCQLPI